MNNKEVTLICFLDKEYPPQHSFVDGMLSDVSKNNTDIKVELVVSKGNSRSNCKRYKGMVCFSILYARKGLKQFLNLFLSILFLKKIIKRERKLNREIVVFVRNYPIYLLAASLIRKKYKRLIFQNSFPHEEAHPSILKRKFAKLLYKMSSSSVDGLLTVSPLGMERIEKYFPKSNDKLVIPLLSDFSIIDNQKKIINNDKIPLKFIYIGTHAKRRKLDVILLAIKDAVKKKINANFHFIGGKREEIKELKSIEGVVELCEQGIVKFQERVPRTEIINLLLEADVGLSLIPPLSIYRETSPTKLPEYMSAGLAVLGTGNIPIQEVFIIESKGGFLTEWSVSAISEKIREMDGNRTKLQKMKSNALNYAKNELQYKNYNSKFRGLIGLDI